MSFYLYLVEFMSVTQTGQVICKDFKQTSNSKYEHH